MSQERQAFPLSWPDGWKQTPSSQRTDGRFSKGKTQYVGEGTTLRSYQNKQPITVAQAIERINESLNRMGVCDWNVIVSTNLPVKLNGMPRSDAKLQGDGSPGAVVYWKQNDKSPMRCMAVDKYKWVADNLAAIAATLEAMRAIERHGGAEILERSFRGFAALPERASSPWREVLKFPVNVPLTEGNLKSHFNRFVQGKHPDQGGDRDEFERIIQARDAALLEMREQ